MVDCNWLFLQGKFFEVSTESKHMNIFKAVDNVLPSCFPESL